MSAVVKKEQVLSADVMNALLKTALPEVNTACIKFDTSAVDLYVPVFPDTLLRCTDVPCVAFTRPPGASEDAHDAYVEASFPNCAFFKYSWDG